MQKKSDIIERKFIDTIDIDDYEILTDDGWKDIEFIGKTIEYEVYELKTENHVLKCADTHIVFDENMNEVFVKDLKTGDLIQTENGLEKVLCVDILNFSDNMYDVQLSDNSNHRYYTNGILSHNSTIYCIYALWKAIFWNEQKIMLLANKAPTALELLGRITMAYEYLPTWLKSTVVTFNKGELTFLNRSSIRAFASSSDAARGFSAQCVDENTKITIRLFKFLKLTIPIKWLKYISLNKVIPSSWRCGLSRKNT